MTGLSGRGRWAGVNVEELSVIGIGLDGVDTGLVDGLIVFVEEDTVLLMG